MPEAKKTLIILSPAFAEHEADEWLPSQEHFVRALNRNFPELQVIIHSFLYPVDNPAVYKWFGNTVFAYRGAKKSKWLRLLLWQQVWKNLNAQLKQHEVIGIFSFFCSGCALVGHHFAARHALKHRIWVLGQDAKKENKHVRYIRPAAEELVVISDFLQHQFEAAHGIKPAHNIPIGINPGLYSTEPTERDIDILGVGSLIPLKRYDLLLEIVKTIKEHIPGVRAQHAGDGPLKEELQMLAREYGLEDHFSFEGKKPNQDILRMMQRSKVFLHPSSYEGFVAVGLEALYAGAHVVSFCRPMQADLAHWHVVHTKEEMIAKTLELLQDPQLDHTPVLPYDINDMAKQIIGLFGQETDKAASISDAIPAADNR